MVDPSWGPFVQVEAAYCSAAKCRHPDTSAGEGWTLYKLFRGDNRGPYIEGKHYCCDGGGQGLRRSDIFIWKPFSLFFWQPTKPFSLFFGPQIKNITALRGPGPPKK